MQASQILIMRSSEVNAAGPQVKDTKKQEACIANIGPCERRKRLLYGAAMLALSLLILVALISAGAGRGWRLGLFLPLYGAANGILQAWHRT